MPFICFSVSTDRVRRLWYSVLTVNQLTCVVAAAAAAALLAARGRGCARLCHQFVSQAARLSQRHEQAAAHVLVVLQRPRLLGAAPWRRRRLAGRPAPVLRRLAAQPQPDAVVVVQLETTIHSYTIHDDIINYINLIYYKLHYMRLFRGWGGGSVGAPASQLANKQKNGIMYKMLHVAGMTPRYCRNYNSTVMEKCKWHNCWLKLEL